MNENNCILSSDQHAIFVLCLEIGESYRVACDAACLEIRDENFSFPNVYCVTQKNYS